ncbi:MAG: hypothetical protein KF842_06880 [Caulobacter sp.]|nr:hypothetical protein [Caulobacter sp.]
MTRRLKAREAAVADARDIAKWRRLIAALRAAIDCPGETRELVKARNATRSKCAVPRGQFWVGSPFHRLSQMAVHWTSVTPAARRDLAGEAAALCDRCESIIDAQDAEGRRADLEG